MTKKTRHTFSLLFAYLPIFVDICRYLSIFIDICRYLSIFVDICRYLSLFVAICDPSCTQGAQEALKRSLTCFMPPYYYAPINSGELR